MVTHVVYTRMCFDTVAVNCAFDEITTFSPFTLAHNPTTDERDEEV